MYMTPMTIFFFWQQVTPLQGFDGFLSQELLEKKKEHELNPYRAEDVSDNMSSKHQRVEEKLISPKRLTANLAQLMANCSATDSYHHIPSTADPYQKTYSNIKLLLLRTNI